MGPQKQAVPISLVEGEPPYDISSQALSAQVNIWFKGGNEIISQGLIYEVHANQRIEEMPEKFRIKNPWFLSLTCDLFLPIHEALAKNSCLRIVVWWEREDSPCSLFASISALIRY